MIRSERAEDIEAISRVTVEAFRTHPISRQTEHFIIHALRAASALRHAAAGAMKRKKPARKPDAARGRVWLLCIGGGGGSRTRVRKSSAAASTRLVPDLRFASEASRGRDPSSAILCVGSPHPPQEIGIGYPG